LVAVVAVLLITGPLYTHLGVGAASKAEAYGLLLNQMARVVVEDGTMSSEDEAYMNSLFPLDKYAETYSPTCVDSLKWSAGFNDAALSSGFFQHWASMFVKNPKIYVEAWVMETFGFWAPLKSNSFYYLGNFTGGVIRNIDESRISQLDAFGVSASPKVLSEDLRAVFPVRDWSLPLGLINWVLGFLVLCACLQRKTKIAFVLLPVLVLAGTLLVASPIWYWPRYEAAAQFLLPLYCVLYGMLFSRKQAKE
jgi:hypothetical protein